MKAIIPAKASSNRVPNKNWRKFHEGDSLVDINIRALISAGVLSSDIYVSSESGYQLFRVKARHGVNTLLRDERLCCNETSLADFIRGIVADVPGEDEIIWSQVCDPLFDEHREALGVWDAIKKDHDSLCVVHPLRQYFLDSEFKPLGFGFGAGHIPSQRLPAIYQMPFTLSILTRDSIRDVGYHVGSRPYWYVSQGGCIDIDTESDFRMAQHLYQRTNS